MLIIQLCLLAGVVVGFGFMSYAKRLAREAREVRKYGFALDNSVRVGRNFSLGLLLVVFCGGALAITFFV